MSLDPEGQTVEFVPNERPGSPVETLYYDYVVVAVGAHLGYDQIEGFAEYGHSLSDTYYGENLRRYLPEDYQGGPVGVGSARFHQGTMSRNLVPTAESACEGPPVEVMLPLGYWLETHGGGGPEKVTVFTPGETMAEDAGLAVVKPLLDIAGSLGYHYVNHTEDIKAITQDGVEFANGTSVEAELKMVFPDWQAHSFLHDLPISDDRGFILTNMMARNPRYSNVFACGDAAAVTVPKLGILAHMGAEAVGRQIALDVGRMSPEKTNVNMAFVLNCIGDMGGNKGCAMNSDTWYGGKKSSLKMGHIPFLMKMQYRKCFFGPRAKYPTGGFLRLVCLLKN